MANKKTQKKQAKRRAKKLAAETATLRQVVHDGNRITFTNVELPSGVAEVFNGQGGTVTTVGAVTTVTFADERLAAGIFKALFNVKAPWIDFVNALPENVAWRNGETDALAASMS